MNRRVLAVLISCFLLSCDDKLGNEKPFVFFVIGDWGQRGSAEQMAVAKQMDAWAAMESPKYIISTGDNFYYDGVADTDDSHWSESFENVYNGEHLANVPWIVSLGNHDYQGNPTSEIDYSATSPRWRLPSRYYSFTESLDNGEGIQFAVLDTSPLVSDYYVSSPFKDELMAQDTAQQLRWLSDVTRDNTPGWKIVIGHHPMYTGGYRRNELNSVRPRLEPVFTRNHVDVYISGHEHDLQHLKFNDKPTHQLISGAGAATRPTGTLPETIFSASENGFLVVTIQYRKMRVKFVNDLGEVIHESVISSSR